VTTAKPKRDWQQTSRSSGAVDAPTRIEKTVAYVIVAWCLGFAAVSVWQVVGGLGGSNPYAAYASGIAVMSLVVLVLKLVGAAVAVAAVSPWQKRLPTRLLATSLWGAFALLSLYSFGNIVITVGTVSGLLAPSAAWTAAGGVSAKAVLYVVFFLVGAAAFGFLAASFHRRRHTPRIVVLAGVVGAPVVLALLLAVAPAVLGWLGLLPT
jgi:uncharacterized membrane protein YeaQ/YmgE (transglycosylase-associated protein family)